MRIGFAIAVAALLVPVAAASAQTPCRSTAVYQPCDIEFEITEQEAAQHPNPYLSVELRAEFRGPGGDTYRLPGFWDGGRRFKVRFAPLAEGRWDFRVTSNIERFAGKIESFTATAATDPGFVLPFNVHHFRYSKPETAHYWMGDTRQAFATMPADAFRRLIDVRAGQKFNHLRGLVLGDAENAGRVFPSPDQIVPAYFQNLDERIRYMNQKGITCDLILAGGDNQLEKLFPNWRQRERYIRYLVARYAAMNVTWQGFEEFESYPNGPALLKEIGDLLKQLDVYRHPRSTGTQSTSGALVGGATGPGWMSYVTHNSSNPSLFTIEYQLYPAAFVNLGSAQGEADTLRRRLWNAAISGEHVTLGEVGVDSPVAQQAAHLYNFFAQTRYFDLEPYFRIEGARALALEEVEYIVYLEKPAPVELIVHKAGYDVSWFNPITGQFTDAPDFKGERYTVGTPPDPSHDWILYIRREGKKRGMGREYKLESRRPAMQTVEVSKNEVPFTIQLPAETELPAGKPLEFNATLIKTNRATRNITWLWTGEVSSSGLGYRALASSQFGEFTIPRDIAREYPSALLMRLYGLDGNGKLYATDKVYTLKK